MTVPPGVSLSFTNPFQTPTWTRIDNLAGLDITSISITRGRPDERSKTNAGTVTIRGFDETGILDPTNPNGPFYGNLDPVKQAAVSLWNPYLNTWSYIFKGYISDITE